MQKKRKASPTEVYITEISQLTYDIERGSMHAVFTAIRKRSPLSSMRI